MKVNAILLILKNPEFNPFHATGFFPYLLKTSDFLSPVGIKRPVAWNMLNRLILHKVLHQESKPFSKSNTANYLPNEMFEIIPQMSFLFNPLIWSVINDWIKKGWKSVL